MESSLSFTGKGTKTKRSEQGCLELLKGETDHYRHLFMFFWQPHAHERSRDFTFFVQLSMN